LRALVTGGAGFIGSHLCEYLLGRSWDVVVIDDLSTGCTENLSAIMDDDRFCFVEGDACDAVVMDALVSQCDVVYHLAAAVGVQLIVDRPVHTIETNIHGTEVVLEAAKKHGKKVLIASTSEVYGKSEQVPFCEDDDTVLGSTRFSRWSYACSKAIDEFLSFAYHDQYGLDVVVVRLFNTIGPRQIGQYGMVVPRFVERAVKGEDLQIYGTGQQSRCFTYVGDVVRALCGLMDSDAAAGQVFNVGSQEEISVEALADKIIAMVGSGSVKKFISYEQAYGRSFDDMMRRVPSLERISRVIGFSPEFELEQTLQTVIDDVRQKLEKNG
jgi:UDP-glucose 4-epimerase